MEHGASHPVKVPIEIMDVDEEEQSKNTTWGGCQTASRWPFFLFLRQLSRLVNDADPVEVFSLLHLYLEHVDVA